MKKAKKKTPLYWASVWVYAKFKAFFTISANQENELADHISSKKFKKKKKIINKYLTSRQIEMASSNDQSFKFEFRKFEFKNFQLFLKKISFSLLLNKTES